MIGRIIHLIRYRFLLFAGLLPYCFGNALAYNKTAFLNLNLFLIGLAGMIFVLVGVETFNEYFDWQIGTDRIFQLNPKPVTKKTFYIGMASFASALVFAIYLTLKVGWGIALFSLAGFIAAAGYLGPPLRFTYRGLGEIVIALSYGPFMVLGSYYLQTKTVELGPFLVSIIPAILIFQIAIMNEVPDFIQDRLVGKRNLCVRLGRENAVRLFGLLTTVFFLVCLTHALTGSRTHALIFFLTPLAYYIYRKASINYDTPILFLPAIRGTIILYVIAMLILLFGLILPQK